MSFYGSLKKKIKEDMEYFSLRERKMGKIRVVKFCKIEWKEQNLTKKMCFNKQIIPYSKALI